MEPVTVFIQADFSPQTLPNYSILQVDYGTGWVDYATIKNESDKLYAVGYVLGRLHVAESSGFRIYHQQGCKVTLYVKAN